MAIVKVPTPAEGNQNYPLVADYYDLTDNGQRLARINACRQWLVRYPTIKEKADAYVAALWFFDTWYLWPDEEADYNPLFYDDDPCESPEYHWLIARQWISWRKNMTMAPRGGAKSFLNSKDILLRNTTRPAYSFVYATSTHPNARDTGERLKRQWLFNQRLRDDWDPEFGGTMIPKRGEGTFSTEHMMLTNGSWIRLLSAQSRQRGARPRRYRLDDPEYDPRASTPMSVLREYIRELLFKIVIPMVTRPDTGVDWIGTYVSKRHYLWHAMQVEDTPDGPRARDPRFNRWSRLEVPAAIEHEGKLVSCWKSMWPATIKEREEMVKEDDRYRDAYSLEEIRLDIGSAAFNSEFLGRPGDTEDTFFPLNADAHGPHAYWFEEIDDRLAASPTTSDSLICWHEFKGDVVEKRRMPLKVFLTEYTRSFMSSDTSYTSGSDSDFKGGCLMAVTPNNDLFILDLWARQCKEAVLVKALFAMGDLWRCPTIHPEFIKEQASLFNALYAIVVTRATDMAGVEHLPAIKKLNVGIAEKTSKIAGLLFRFEHSKIKLPIWKREQLPWRMLFDQIEEFNPDVEDGGLEKDDCIDMVSMSQFILKGRLNRAGTADAPTKTLFERLISGEYINEVGDHVGHGLPLNALTYDQIQEILQSKDNQKRAARPSKV